MANIEDDAYIAATTTGQNKTAQDELNDEAQEDGSDWEYEYDPDETEDIYVTVDLTSQVPEDHRFPRLTVDKETGALRPVTNPSTEADPDTETNQPLTEDPSTSTYNPHQRSAQHLHPRRIKVADLHTDSPFLVVDDKLYSCNWATAIGTDLHFAPASPSLKPLTSNIVKGRVSAPSATDYIPTHPLFGMTAARLVAQPARLKPKDILSETIDPSISREALQRKRLADQSSFLESFQALKRRMGEADTVPRTGLPGLGRAQIAFDTAGMALSRGEEPDPQDIQDTQGSSWGASQPRVRSLLDIEGGTLSVPPEEAPLPRKRKDMGNPALVSHQSRNARKKRHRPPKKLVMFAEDDDEEEEDDNDDDDDDDDDDEGEVQGALDDDGGDDDVDEEDQIPIRRGRMTPKRRPVGGQ